VISIAPESDNEIGTLLSQSRVDPFSRAVHAVGVTRQMPQIARHSCATLSTDAVLARLAARRHVVVTLAQLFVAGLSRKAIARRVVAGRDGHERPRTQRNDARRDAMLSGAGWLVLRFTGDEVEQRPRQVPDRLRAA
jgi:hypothetical protein